MDIKKLNLTRAAVDMTLTMLTYRALSAVLCPFLTACSHLCLYQVVNLKDPLGHLCGGNISVIVVLIYVPEHDHGVNPVGMNTSTVNNMPINRPTAKNPHILDRMCSVSSRCQAQLAHSCEGIKTLDVDSSASALTREPEFP
jgi:hypothetical protein